VGGRQRSSASLQRSGSSDSTLMRARTSSSRLVSWLELAIMARGRSLCRSAFETWKRSSAFARGSG